MIFDFTKDAYLNPESYYGEIWVRLPLADWRDKYEISNYGRLRTRARKVKRMIRGKHESIFPIKSKIRKVRKNKVNPHWYTNVNGKVKGVRTQRTIYIHHMVALAFVPNFENKDKVTFKNRNPDHVLSSNLQWVSQSYLSKNNFVKHPKNRDVLYLKLLKKGIHLTRDQHQEIRDLHRKGADIYHLADLYDVSITTIRYHVLKKSPLFNKTT